MTSTRTAHNLMRELVDVRKRLEAAEAERDKWRHEAECHDSTVRESIKWIEDAVKSYGFEKQGDLQSAWRNGERDDPRELEAAICDALAMGCWYVTGGDGASCAAQIVEYWLRRAKAAEAVVEAARLSDERLHNYLQGDDPRGEKAQMLSWAIDNFRNRLRAYDKLKDGNA